MRLVLLALAALVTLHMLGRRFRVEPRDPAPLDDVDWFVDWVIEPRYRPAYLTASEWRN